MLRAPPPQAKRAPAPGISAREPREPTERRAPKSAETVEQHYREDKEKLAEIKKRRPTEPQARLDRERVQRTADDLFSRFVERVESPADSARSMEERDELFDRFVDRIGGEL
jgi:hypothetical protein